MGILDIFTGKDTQTTEVPAWYDALGQALASRAQAVSNLGFTPYRGLDVAAFTPMQQAAFRGTNQAANAFGMPTVGSQPGQGGLDGMMGQPRTQGGVAGYSSYPMLREQMEALKARSPNAYAALVGWGGQGNAKGGHS